MLAVLDRLAEVPRRRDDRGRENDHSKWTPSARHREGEHDGRKRPEGEGTHELAEPERDAGPKRELPPVVRPPQQASREQERNGGQQHRQRLGMEHRTDA